MPEMNVDRIEQNRTKTRCQFTLSTMPRHFDTEAGKHEVIAMKEKNPREENKLAPLNSPTEWREVGKYTTLS